MAIDINELVYSEEIEKFSSWKNNNTDVARFRLLTDKKRTGVISGRSMTKPEEANACQVSVFLNVEIKPGETKMLPSEYDNSIRRVDTRTGQVVGGACPWLTKIGEEDIVVHKSLDYRAALQGEQTAIILEDMKKENDLRAALAEIEKRKLADVKKVGRPKTVSE